MLLNPTPSHLQSYLIYPLSLLFLAVIGLYGLSIPFTANRIMHGLEGSRVALDLEQPPYDAAVVLTGMLDLDLSTEGAPEFDSGVDRVLAGIDLVQRGIGKRLIIS